jgi:hypothetical protein
VRLRILVSLLVVAVGTVACAKTKDDALPPVVPTVPTTSTTLVDYSTVALAAVQSRPTTTVNQGPGRARLSGTVVGPDGPVPQAVVRVERLQDDAVVFKGDILTDADGKWRTGRLVGGRWRVRAWRAPDLADVQPDTVYLEASQSRSFQLTLDRYGAPAVTASIAPDPPIVGAQANVAVVVTTASVDAEGIVRNAPIPNMLAQLFATNYAIANPNAVPTDVIGHITWLVSCTTPGPSGLSVNLTGVPQPLALPPCAEPPPPPTTAPPPPH